MHGVYDADGNLTLKKNHKYYFQVQGGMAATGTQVCDFVVYTMNTESGCDGGICGNNSFLQRFLG